MSDQEQIVTTKTAPTCYRHPDRETWVSCGRCGRPLCPDCMDHGPVGIRCTDCLRPAGRILGAVAPRNVGRALGVAVFQAVAWVALLAFAGWHSVTGTPNLLLSGMAGGITGWAIWRICGRAASHRTAWAAVIIGLAIPLLSALAINVLGMIRYEELLFSSFNYDVCVLAAIIMSGFFAWLLSTQQPG